MSKRFAVRHSCVRIPLYGGLLYINFTTDIVGCRTDHNDLFGEFREMSRGIGALASYSLEDNVYGLFYRMHDSPHSVIAHEVFHIHVEYLKALVLTLATTTTKRLLACVSG